MIELPKVGDEDRRLAMLQSLGLSNTRDPSLEALATLAADLAGTETGMVSLIESETLSVAGACGFDQHVINRWDSFCSHTLLQPTRLLWVEDARLDHRFRDSTFVVGPAQIRFYAGVPLLVNGCMVGTLCVLGTRPRAFDETLARRLEGVAAACRAELAERHRTSAMRHALAASADALIDCDADGIIQTWSDGAERLFGYSREEALGGPVTLIIPLDHQHRHNDGMRRWRDSGGARLGRRIDLPARRKDGSHLDIELWMSVSHDNGATRLHGNIRDISERRAQARELAAAVARAEDANQAKTNFLANMSHELRTPLNGVTACAGLLADSSLKPEQLRLVELVQGAGEQLGRLIADLLDLARIESGELCLDPVPTDLGELVEGTASLSRLKADEKGVSLRLDLAPDARGPVLVDGARLKQVLTNLLCNAIKFTDEGEVALSVRREGARVRFEVRDTGIGFAADQHGVIFDRFQQADPTITRRFGGTGLGLAICRDLIQAMSGTLDCRSEPGRGSLFWIELDLPVVSDTVAEPETRPGRPEDMGGLHVLVVDDNDTNRQVAGLILEAGGMVPTYAETGREALKALASARYDVVLMDMMMPEMDGVEATRRLRAGEVGATVGQTPVIMLTANTLPEHVAQSHAAGADRHLAKPITPAALLQSIAEVLNARSEILATAEAAIA